MLKKYLIDLVDIVKAGSFLEYVLSRNSTNVMGYFETHKQRKSSINILQLSTCRVELGLIYKSKQSYEIIEFDMPGDSEDPNFEQIDLKFDSGRVFVYESAQSTLEAYSAAVAHEILVPLLKR